MIGRDWLQGITSSIGGECDTGQNTQGADPDWSHVGINLNGRVTSMSPGTPGHTGVHDRDEGRAFAWVGYGGTPFHPHDGWDA